MQGAVQQYKNDKGFGFISSDELDSNIFFHISEWKHPSTPEIGDIVFFDTEQTEKGPRAINVKLSQKAQQNYQHNQQAFNANDSRITCPGCNKKMVPRMITYRGKPQKSVCPFCAQTIKKWGIPFGPIFLGLIVFVFILANL